MPEINMHDQPIHIIAASGTDIPEGLGVSFSRADTATAIESALGQAAGAGAAIILAPGSNGEAVQQAALEAVSTGSRLVEVHADNVFKEEDVQPLHLAPHSNGLICGLGGAGMALAVHALSGSLPQSDGKGSVLVIGGPNLNLLGTREPEIYGHDTLADIEARCQALAGARGLTLDFMQSNHEGEIVDAIQQAIRDNTGTIIINAAAYTHTSVAIHDALKAYPGRVIELHISNPHSREAFRHTSLIAPVAHSVIAGLGTVGYELALAAAGDR